VGRFPISLAWLYQINVRQEFYTAKPAKIAKKITKLCALGGFILQNQKLVSDFGKAMISLDCLLLDQQGPAETETCQAAGNFSLLYLCRCS
jgi:hypothetical protein